MVQLVAATMGKEMGRKAGEAEGHARRHGVSGGGGRPPVLISQNKGASRKRSEGFCFFAAASRSSYVVFWCPDQWATTQIATRCHWRLSCLELDAW